MHFVLNSSKGITNTIRVFGDDYSEDYILIHGKWISELKKYDLFSEGHDNEPIISIIYHAILLKNNNKKTIEGSVAKYKLGNDTDFIYKLVPQLEYFLRTNSIDTLVAFFEDAKIQDLDNFINHPEFVEF